MTSTATDGDGYPAAHRLLSQLRAVARRLSAGLDATALADALLREVAGVAPYDRGAVLVAGAGGALVQLAAIGPDGVPTTVPWEVGLAAETPLADAWLSQHPQVSAEQQAVPGTAARRGSGLVVPLGVGARTFGLLALETGRLGGYPREVVAAVERIATDAALRLDTALLFDEVRAVATTEERRRVAREIHDGVAQDLASLGYALDGLAADAEGSAPALADGLRGARDALTGVLREVRESITTLRSGVDEHRGLGAAVSDYALTVAAGAPYRLHLSLDEASSRLPPQTEGELFRIAQEAITNARRHADAGNLWVTCVIRPPAALLRIEDDGRGLSGRGRRDSYGLDIMRERAHRLGASLLVRGRTPTGTLVEVRLGRDESTGTRPNEEQWGEP